MHSKVTDGGISEVIGRTYSLLTYIWFRKTLWR